MRRLVSIMAVLGVVVTLILAAFASTPSSAQDGAEGTIAAQETRIVELEGTVAARGERINAQRTTIAELRGEGEAGGEPTTEVEAEPGDSATSLFGVAPDSLPQGEDGQLSIILTGVPVRNYLPVVLRNNTGGDAYVNGLEGVVRDASGALLGSVGLSYVAPYQVRPGEVAVGYVYFDGIDELPVDATYDLEPDFESTESDFSFNLDLPVTEAGFSEDGIVGIVQNPVDHDVSGGSVVGICFSAEGEIVGYFSGSTDKFDIPAGDDSAFGARFEYPGGSFGDGVTASASCPAYLIGVVGADFS